MCQLCSICVPCCPCHGWGGREYSQVFVVIFRDLAELTKELNQLNEKQGYSEPIPKGSLSLCQSCLVRRSKVCTVSGVTQSPAAPIREGDDNSHSLSPEHLPQLQFHFFVLDTTPEPIFQVEFSKLENQWGKSKKGDRSKNVSFTSKLEAWNPSRNCCWLIVSQLVKLTPCQYKLASIYLQGIKNQSQAEVEIIRLVCIAC